MRRICSLLVSIVMLLGITATMCLPASAIIEGTYNGLRYSIENDQVTIIDYIGVPTSITIPAKINGYPVTEIGAFSFHYCSTLKEIKIPDSVTKIKSGAFSYCSNLTAFIVSETHPRFSTVSGVLFNKGKTELLIYPAGKSNTYTIPNGVTSIKDSAFQGCGGLTKITLPNSVTSIGAYAFCDCDSLTEIDIPNGVTSIKDSTFQGCSSLARIAIPLSVKSVASFAFHDCFSLNDIYYGGNESQWKVWLYYATSNSGNHLLEYARVHYNSSGLPTATSVDVSKQFTDVKKGTWYYNAVSYAYNNELFKGMTQTTFAPNAQMTRGMFVTVLGRLAGVSLNNNVSTKFKDVAKGKWYTGAVKWASDNGIVGGTSPNTFAPDANVTREQICKMMAEYCNYAGVSLQNKSKAVTFKDANQISDWAKKYVATCQRAGLVNGSDGKFNPKGNATRAEVAQILMNFANNYLK